MIACDRVTVRRGPRSLLSGVSISIPAGHLCALVGPNGAGKSTLLHVLAGDHPPSAGQVFAMGRPLRSWAPSELAKVRAVVPQEATLAFPFTALEVVLLGRSPHVRFSETREDVEIARGALDEVGAAHLEHRLYTTLSGGERQRVHFARALAQVGGPGHGAARVLLLDEPTSNLDPAHQHGTLRIARALAEDGACVLVVLHDLNLAAQHADTIALLHAGRIRAHGPPEAALDEALLTEVFGVPMRVVRAPWDPQRLLVAVLPSTRHGHAASPHLE